MSKIVKTILTFATITFEYIFTSIIYPNMQQVLALKQAENPEAAFNGFQFLQFIHSYLWIILSILIALIWFKEIKSMLKRI